MDKEVKAARPKENTLGFLPCVRVKKKGKNRGIQTNLSQGFYGPCTARILRGLRFPVLLCPILSDSQHTALCVSVTL